MDRCCYYRYYIISSLDNHLIIKNYMKKTIILCTLTFLVSGLLLIASQSKAVMVQVPSAMTGIKTNTTVAPGTNITPTSPVVSPTPKPAPQPTSDPVYTPTPTPTPTPTHTPTVEERLASIEIRLSKLESK